jgi:DNA-binding transcriptional ArsR family regulator
MGIRKHRIKKSPLPGASFLPLTCNQKVAYNKSMVTDEDRVFKALADASRRRLLDRLQKKGGLTLTELCVKHDMSRQAVTKHLALLEDANLVVTVKRGREKLHYLNTVPINDIYMRWIGKFERGRLTALHNLKQALQEREND